MKAALLSVFLVLLCVIPTQAQDYEYDPSMYQAMEWRNIGPYRGGRATTVAGLQHGPL